MPTNNENPHNQVQYNHIKEMEEEPNQVLKESLLENIDNTTNEEMNEDITEEPPIIMDTNAMMSINHDTSDNDSISTHSSMPSLGPRRIHSDDDTTTIDENNYQDDDTITTVDNDYEDDIITIINDDNDYITAINEHENDNEYDEYNIISYTINENDSEHINSNTTSNWVINNRNNIYVHDNHQLSSTQRGDNTNIIDQTVQTINQLQLFTRVQFGRSIHLDIDKIKGIYIRGIKLDELVKAIGHDELTQTTSNISYIPMLHPTWYDPLCHCFNINTDQLRSTIRSAVNIIN